MRISKTASIIVALALPAIALHAGTAPTHATIPAGTRLVLITAKELTSKHSVKGDQVELLVAEDVFVDGVRAVPKGSAAVGTISLAENAGAFGQSGELVITPLYVTVGNEILRLTGEYGARGTKNVLSAVGLSVLGVSVKGRTAKIASGTTIRATIMFEKTIELKPDTPLP